jgi:hypothetical protein
VIIEGQEREKPKTAGVASRARFSRFTSGDSLLALRENPLVKRSETTNRVRRGFLSFLKARNSNNPFDSRYFLNGALITFYPSRSMSLSDGKAVDAC